MLTPYARDTLTITVDELTGDWSGWTFKGDIRAARDSTADLIVAFTVDTSNLASSGIVTFTVPAATMQAQEIPVRAWHYDLRAERNSDGVEVTFAQDAIQPRRNVTP